MAKRKRFFQKRQTVDSEPAEIQNVSENIQPTQDDIVKKYEKKKEIENKETKDASTSSFKPTGIIKYVYLIAFFALLAGIMAPIVDPYESQTTIENSYKGIGILFVGLIGGILIFKSTRSFAPSFFPNSSSILTSIGFFIFVTLQLKSAFLLASSLLG